jgi:hypothetical protein
MAGEQSKQKSPYHTIGNAPAPAGARQQPERAGEAGDADSAESRPRDAQQGAYVFKAGSALPEEKLDALNADQVFLVRYRDEFHAILADDLQAAFPGLVAQYASRNGTIDLREILNIRAASTKSAVPHLIGTIGSNNIVSYDGRFYVIPFSAGAVDNWGAEDVAGLPGVAAVDTLREAFSIAAARSGGVERQAKAETAESRSGPAHGTSQPRLVKTVESAERYNIVEYEGWYYGLPQTLGPIDLETVDVIEMPSVIRDVSADVVEREILDLKR